MADSALTVVDQIADLFWAGRMGYKTIAGLGVAQIYILIYSTARIGLDAGMRAMISRAIGANDREYANHVLLQALTMTFIWTLVVGGLGIIFADKLLSMVGVSGAVVESATMYMQLQFVAYSMQNFIRLTGGALNAAGDSINPLKAVTVSRGVHILSSPFFIFGWLWFPDMGIAGAAAANIVAQFLGLIMNLVVLHKGNSGLKLSFKSYRVDIILIWRLFRVGLPAAMTSMQRSISQLVLLVCVSRFGDAPVAAFALSRRVENIVNNTSRGLGRASAAVAGQNLGAGYLNRAKSSLSWALVYSAILSAIAMTLYLLFTEEIAAVFNGDPNFIGHMTTWLIILAIATFPMSSVQVLTHGISNTGATVAPMNITLTTMWLIEIPMAFGLALLTPLDSGGVPWGIACGNGVRCLAFLWYFYRGSWLKSGVI
jgi:putative MATE family efflux protein